MNKFSGIVLQSNNSVIVVSDEADRIVYQRRFSNDPVQIRASLAPHREDLVGAVIEATFNLYWLVDALLWTAPRSWTLLQGVLWANIRKRRSAQSSRITVLERRGSKSLLVAVTWMFRRYGNGWRVIVAWCCWREGKGAGYLQRRI